MHKDGTTPVALHAAGTMDGGLHSTDTVRSYRTASCSTPVLTLLCFTY